MVVFALARFPRSGIPKPQLSCKKSRTLFDLMDERGKRGAAREGPSVAVPAVAGQEGGRGRGSLVGGFSKVSAA